MPGGTLLVYPQESLAAPLGVTEAAIIFPGEGTIIAGRELVYPRALLATTGVGTIIGSWQFDGMVFDRFVTTVSSGFPAEVRASSRSDLVCGRSSPERSSNRRGARLSVHHDHRGHRQRIAAPCPRSARRQRGGDRTTFRWSLVPYASGASSSFCHAQRARCSVPSLRPISRSVSQSHWRPTSEQLRSLAAGLHSWRVRAIFPGETPGQPTAWQPSSSRPTIDLSIVSTDGGVVRWTGGVAGLLSTIPGARRPGGLHRLTCTVSCRSDSPSSPATPSVTALGRAASCSALRGDARQSLRRGTRPRRSRLSGSGGYEEGARRRILDEERAA